MFMDPAKAINNSTGYTSNIKELFPAHSRKIDILEQRLGAPSTVSNDAVDTNERMEEEDESEEEDQFSVNTITEEPPKQTSNKAKEIPHKYGRFSQEEDKIIVEGHAKFGNRWDEIVRWGNLERSASQISSRFTRINKTRDDDRYSKGTESDEQPPTKQRRVEGSVKETNGTAAAANQSTTTTALIPASTSQNTPSYQPNTNTNTTTTTTAPLQQPIKDMQETDQVKIENEVPDNKHLQLERERLQNLEAILQEKENKLKDWEARLKKGTDDHGRVSEVVRGMLIEKTRATRALVRKKLADDCQRLGNTTFERRGVEMHEVWQDGELFKEVDEKLRVLGAKREHFDNIKKQLAKRRQSTSTSADGLDSDVEEICKVRIMGIKREEVALQEERERLQGLKMIHMKELKRVQDEDQSRFNDFPVLHDSRYLLLSLLGKGGFSEVYYAYDLKELREVACKIHSVNTMWSTAKRQNYTKHAIREYKIHKELAHPKVVRLYSVFEIDANSFCTVLEYCEGGDMDSYLKQHKVLSEREAKCILAQIFSGLKYLNSQKCPIIHYDLKPGNILFHSNGEVKITDFGLSKIVEDPESEFVELTSQGAGTYWYLPPECFELGGQTPPRISSKVDVWSVGVIFYQMLYGRRPFGNDMSQQKFLADNIAAQTTRVEFPNKPVVSKEAKDFVLKCLTHSHKNRPDVQTCCLDPFLLPRPPGKKAAPTTPNLSSMPPPKRKADNTD